MPAPYFRRRALPADALTDYHGTRRDPDGRERHQTSAAEHMLSIADIRQECAWLIGCERVLDLGCGTGAAAAYVLKEYVGVDPSVAALSAAIARYPHRSFVSDVNQIAPDGKPFDALISYHVVEHMTDPVGTMKAALDRCVSGARVVIGTPDFDSPSARKYGDRFRLLHDPTHISLFSTAGLVEMLRDLGVDVLRIEYPFRGTRFETAAAEWVDTGSNCSPPAIGNIVSVYGVKR